MKSFLEKTGKSYLKPLLFSLFLLGIFFRVYNIWYSEFQGDEIESISFTSFKGNFWQFLMSRSKGPGQYLVNFCVQLFANDSLRLELYTRLPYLLAGVLVLLILYKCIRRHYGFWMGFIVLSFACLSGLLIAFSKIAQYQSFILLFSILSIYLVINYYDKGNSWHLMLSGLLSGVSLLFHYDSLSFIIPIIIFLVLSRKIQKLKIYLIPLLLIPAIYYTFFTLSPNFKETASYIWSKRINSSSSDANLQLMDILNVYHSREALLVIILGLFAFVYLFIKKYDRVVGGLFILSIAILFLKALIPDFRNVLYVASLIAWTAFLISYLFKVYNSKDHRSSIFEFWFLFSFYSYIVVIKFPLTHIYTFFLPMFVVVSLSLTEFFKQKPVFLQLFIALFIVSSTSFNYSAFIDVKEEYPWQKKEYVFGTMFSDIANKEQVKGVFGFPYQRGWRNISSNLNEEFASNQQVSFNSNEKLSITQYYVDMKGNKYTFNQYDPDVYIFIKRPQSLVNTIKVRGEPFAKGDRYALYRKNEYKLGF